MPDIAYSWPIPPSLQDIRKWFGQAQERLGVWFATAYRWKGGSTALQRVACSAIAPPDSKKFGDGTR